MKVTWVRKLTAVLCCVMLLGSLVSIGASAQEVLNILDGQDVVYLSLAEEQYLYCYEVPSGYEDTEALVWTSDNESVLMYDENTLSFRACGAGEAILTAATQDNAYTDSVKVIVYDVCKMNGDTATLYINHFYPSRTFIYTASESGYYHFTTSDGADSMIFGVVYNMAYEYAGDLYEDGYVWLEADTQYYLNLKQYMESSAVVDFALTFVGEVDLEPVDATAVVLDRDSVTLAVGDSIQYPSYQLVPDNSWYEDVMYTVEDPAVLEQDPENLMLKAVSAGTTTVTVTTENGLTDTMTVTVLENRPALTVDQPLNMFMQSDDNRYVQFTAPEAAVYSLYSVSENEMCDPRCTVYSAAGEELLMVDDEIGFDFCAQLEMEEGATVVLCLGAYTATECTVYAAKTTELTGVELQLNYYVTMDEDSNTAYVLPGVYVKPYVLFMDGPTALREPSQMTVESDVMPDEEGYCYLEAGQSATFTIVTESGLTDTLTVKAIDWVKGDVTFDGEVDAQDVLQVFAYINGQNTPAKEQLANMEITGDNALNLADPVRMFYYVSGLIATL